MWSNIVILCLSSGVLIKASDIVVSQSRQIAYQFRLSKLFVALILVALGTSLPELTISALAIQQRDFGLSLGGIIGSNITNATLILGVAILISPLKIGTIKTQQNSWLLLLVTALFIGLLISSISSIISGAILVGLALGSMGWQYIKAVNGRTAEDKKSLKTTNLTSQPIALVVGKAFWGLILLVISGAFLVKSIETLSIDIGISTTVLGLTLASLSTSLPELATTIIAQRQGEYKIALGNILGSNIYNLAFIGGLISFSLPNQSRNLSSLAIPELIITSVILFAIIKFWKGKVVSKKIGISLLLVYFLFLSRVFI